MMNDNKHEKYYNIFYCYWMPQNYLQDMKDLLKYVGTLLQLNIISKNMDNKRWQQTWQIVFFVFNGISTFVGYLMPKPPF